MVLKPNQIEEEFVVDFAKKRRLEEVVDYSMPKNQDGSSSAVSLENGSVTQTKQDDYKGTAKYALGQFALNIESQMVKSQDDPIYRASIEISKAMTSDSVYSKVFALVGYFVANEITGKNLKRRRIK